MTILELVSIVSGGASIVGGVDVIRKHFTNSTPEDLFKKSFVDAVKQLASSLADVADPKTIEVDLNTLDQVLASLRDSDSTDLVLANKNEKLLKATDHFQKCIILPGHQLTPEELVRRLQPILERTITNFYDRLPRNQHAANQMMLKSDRMQLEGQEHLNEQNKVILDGIQGLDVKVSDLSNRHLDVSVSDAVETAIAKEYQSEVDDTRVLLDTYRPQSALDQFEKLKERIWTDAPAIVKFRILTNMAAAQFALNNEQEAAKLIIEAFQYNSEDEKALSNRALAHLLLGETKNAADYAKQTLKKNHTNTDAYVILIRVSAAEESLEEVVAKVPNYLQDNPQIAHAISDIANQRRNFVEAKRWGEISMAREQENNPVFKASLATILIQEVLDGRVDMYTMHSDDSQKEQLSRAVELLTEAWDCVVNTELRSARTDWIINRSTALRLLGKPQDAIKDLDVAIEIEPSDSILSTLLKNRAVLAFEQGNQENAIEFLERIQSEPEIFEAQILIANILFATEDYEKVITKLTDFLTTNPSSELHELQDAANRLLVRIYIVTERFDEAKRILTPMLESSPTSVLNLINAALISSNTGKRDEAISQLKEAYDYARDSEDFLEIVQLAAELYIHEQFKEAATLYEKLADTGQNTQLTQWLLKSHYNAGEIGKALEICKGLREKYGPLENVTEMEVIIYEQIGDMKQAEAVCRAYLKEFPDDIDVQIRLGMVYYRSGKAKEIDPALDSFSDFKNLSLPACVQLAHLYQVMSESEKALRVMYETRRTHFGDRDTHLQYIKLYYQVEKQIPEVLNPTQVQLDTAVQIDTSDQSVWYIMVDRDDVDIKSNERDINDPFMRRLLGKIINEEVNCGRTLLGTTKIGKITAIKSKYVHALQESFEKYPELFPGDQGLGSITLDDSNQAEDSTKFQPLLDFVNKRHEASLQIEDVYKEHLPPIGVFMGWTRRNALDAWSFLIDKPDLGIKCSVGSAEEKSQALALLNEPKPKLVVDIISLITLHCLGAADTVVEVFGKLYIAQSTIDEILQIIHEREGMWSQREGMSIEKQGNRYVRHMINPGDVKRNIERLKDLMKWIRKNCEVLPCNAMLHMNLFQKRKLDDIFQPLFMDTLLIASQPGHLLLSDDGRLRTYAETNFNSDVGTNFQIEGVWTQVVLEHCLNQNVLDKTEYNKMVIQLVCTHYYHTEFDADTLIEALKQANWNLAEPYNSLVQTLGGQKMRLQQKTLNIVVDFLFKIWEEPIPYGQLKFVTFGLLAGLTSGRDTHEVLDQLEYLIQNKYILFFPVENRILRQIQVYEQIYPFESNFEFLSEDNIRIKGTRIGIETVLYEVLYLSQTPEEIVQNFDLLTLEQVYSTLLYYLQNPKKIGDYLADNLQYNQILREEYEKNPPPGVVRMRQLKAERQAASDDSQTRISKDNPTTAASLSKTEQE